MQNESSPLLRTGTQAYRYAMIAGIGGLISGYDTGSIASIIALPIFREQFFRKESIAFYESLLLASFLVTSMLGAFSSGYVCDVLGRNRAMLCSNMLVTAGIGFELLGLHTSVLWVGRLLAGLGTGLMTNAIPLYQAEIAPAALREKMVSMYSLLTYSGQLMGYFVTFGTSYWVNDWGWRGPWLLQLGLCGLWYVLLPLLPPSPRWVEMQGVSRLQPKPQPIHYRSLFQGTDRQRTLWAFFIALATCLMGHVVILYYAPHIFRNAGLDNVSISLALTGGVGALSLLANTLSLRYWVWGRRALFSIGALLASVLMATVGLLFYLFATIQDGVMLLPHFWARVAITVCIYLFSIVFAGTWAIGTYLYTAEIFSNHQRAKGLSLTYAISWAGSILITFATPYLLDYSVSAVYFFFAACSFGTFLVVLGFLPETQGKSLEEIDLLFY
ncbi:general substrate transporter [Sporodiniella umbellata]|nr:general substrate transporter [Sporodiniella umbellata]